MKHRALSIPEREPLAVRAAVTAAVAAVMHVLVAFGLPIPEEAETAIVTAVDAVGLVLLLVWARAAVTPNATVVSHVTVEGEVVAGDAAIAPTGTTIPVVTRATGATPAVPSVPVNPDLVAQPARD